MAIFAEHTWLGKIENWLGNIVKEVGSYTNDFTGQTAAVEQADKIADENADVAFERQKELMQMEHDMNSVGTKAQQLGSAGLNPALASGVSNTVGGASAQMSSPNNGQGNALGVMKSLSDLSLLNEQKRGLRLDNDIKEQELHEMKDSYPIRWLGMQSDTTLKLTKAQREKDESDMLRYELGWLRKSEDERLSILRSEKNKNNAIAEYNRMSAKEKELTNSQLDNWINKYMDDAQKAELEHKLAQAESIKDANERANFIFWAKVSALVVGGVCMFIPGAQGLGVGLMASSIGWDAASQIGGSVG